MISIPLIPANAGTQIEWLIRSETSHAQSFNRSCPVIWVPAFAGMSGGI